MVRRQNGYTTGGWPAQSVKNRILAIKLRHQQASPAKGSEVRRMSATAGLLPEIQWACRHRPWDENTYSIVLPSHVTDRSRPSRNWGCA